MAARACGSTGGKRDPKKSAQHFLPKKRLKYAFVASSADGFSVKRMCKVLRVTRSGYYAWSKRQPSQREQSNQALLESIQQIFHTSHRTYGSPRIWASLRRKGYVCGHNRVARLMHTYGIVARRRRRRIPLTTQRQPGVIPAPNLLQRDFSADRPNRKWVTDITYIDTAEGWLYLASVMDLFSRKVVGWAMSDKIDSALSTNALRMAWTNRRPLRGLLHHSDQGRQFTGAAYQQMLAEMGCMVSMNRTGECYDNASMESFFATLKTECVTKQFASRAEARRTIFEYLEGWYNRQRLHSSLDYRSPAEFEASSGH
ncbi:MAG TPA: IS3 family transposase [Anaerolineales bacterium]